MHQDLEEVWIWLKGISIDRQGAELQGSVSEADPGLDNGFDVNQPQLCMDAEISTWLQVVARETQVAMDGLQRAMVR